MALYAIGDLHLHYGTELKARMQLTDRRWKDHEEKFRKNCLDILTDEDTLVLAGDNSWGKNAAECAKDMEYIAGLPGRKILLRGNHDMYWDAAKTEKLNAQYAGKFVFLQNNCYSYKKYAIVGTKGYTFEGPFYRDKRSGKIKWNDEDKEKADKLIEREITRLRISFETAKKDGFEKFIMFLHYPPTDITETDSPFTSIAEEYGASKVIYAHCHGAERYGDSISGFHNGIEYRLVSGDFLRWMPERIL